jgi:hypothetical protein
MPDHDDAYPAEIVVVRESIPFSFWRLFVGHFLFVECMFSLFVTLSILFFACLRDLDLMEAMIAGLCFGAIATPGVLLHAISAAKSFVSNRVEVVAQGRMILLIRVGQTPSISDVSDCSWMAGNIIHATVCPGLILIGGNIILLQISDQEGRLAIVPVGFSRDSKQAWQKFIQENEIRRDESARRNNLIVFAGMAILALLIVAWCVARSLLS